MKILDQHGLEILDDGEDEANVLFDEICKKLPTKDVIAVRRIWSCMTTLEKKQYLAQPKEEAKEEAVEEAVLVEDYTKDEPLPEAN